MYRDAHPDGSAIEFVDEDRGMDPRGGGSLWCSFVTLPEAKGLRFPGPHNAVNPDGTLPSFAKKKESVYSHPAVFSDESSTFPLACLYPGVNSMLTSVTKCCLLSYPAVRNNLRPVAPSSG